MAPCRQPFIPRPGSSAWWTSDVDTWTIRPAADFQYVHTGRRTIFSLNSDPVYFHTESFNASNPNVSVNGNSET
jgi:hypothetical protein